MPASPGGTWPGWLPGSELRVVPATELDLAELDQLCTVYEQAFPPHLRVPLPELATPSARDQLLVALDDGNAVGFAAVRFLYSARWVFLRYYAIAADRRRTGLGRRFFAHLQQALGASGWPARIAFEAEDPAEAADDPDEQAVRQARISFWTSCGAGELAVPGYVMPALTDTGQPEPMVLMAVGGDGWDGPSADELMALVRAIFTEHYGLGPQHPLLAAALGSIGYGRA